MTKQSSVTGEGKSIVVPKSFVTYLKLVQSISTSKATKIALNAFFSPIKYPTPERELFYKHSMPLHREEVGDKKITTYVNGSKPFKTLLVHGWSGRATQFFKLGPALSDANIDYVSFTAPAHGSSTDKKTSLIEFIETLEYLIDRYGPFESIVAHSIGGVAALNAASNHPEIKKVVTIGTSATIQNTIDDFCETLQLNEKVKSGLVKYIKENINANFEEQSAANIAATLKAEGLIIHDKKDLDAHWESANKIHENWKNSELMLTEGLGHRRILSDPKVIAKIIDFIK